MQFWKALDTLVSKFPIIVDRPIGSSHPKFAEIVYPLDYGYLEGTISGDKNGIDVWLGSLGNKIVTGIVVTIDLFKNDSEQKILIGCTDEEMALIERFHNVNLQSAKLVVRSEIRHL